MSSRYSIQDYVLVLSFLQKLDCFNCGEASKVVYLGSTIRFCDIVNLFVACVIKFPCLDFLI